MARLIPAVLRHTIKQQVVPKQETIMITTKDTPDNGNETTIAM